MRPVVLEIDRQRVCGHGLATAHVDERRQAQHRLLARLVEREVAERVKHQRAGVDANALRDVRMVAHDQLHAGLEHGVEPVARGGHGLLAVLDAGVHQHDRLDARGLRLRDAGTQPGRVAQIGGAALVVGRHVADRVRLARDRGRRHERILGAVQQLDVRRERLVRVRARTAVRQADLVQVLPRVGDAGLEIVVHVIVAEADVADADLA